MYIHSLLRDFSNDFKYIQKYVRLFYYFVFLELLCILSIFFLIFVAFHELYVIYSYCKRNCVIYMYSFKMIKSYEIWYMK